MRSRQGAGGERMGSGWGRPDQSRSPRRVQTCLRERVASSAARSASGMLPVMSPRPHAGDGGAAGLRAGATSRKADRVRAWVPGTSFSTPARWPSATSTCRPGWGRPMPGRSHCWSCSAVQASVLTCGFGQSAVPHRSTGVASTCVSPPGARRGRQTVEAVAAVAHHLCAADCLRLRCEDSRRSRLGGGRGRHRRRRPPGRR